MVVVAAAAGGGEEAAAPRGRGRRAGNGKAAMAAASSSAHAPAAPAAPPSAALASAPALVSSAISRVASLKALLGRLEPRQSHQGDGSAASVAVQAVLASVETLSRHLNDLAPSLGQCALAGTSVEHGSSGHFSAPPPPLMLKAEAAAEAMPSSHAPANNPLELIADISSQEIAGVSAGSLASNSSASSQDLRGVGGVGGGGSQAQAVMLEMGASQVSLSDFMRGGSQEEAAAGEDEGEEDEAAACCAASPPAADVVADSPSEAAKVGKLSGAPTHLHERNGGGDRPPLGELEPRSKRIKRAADAEGLPVPSPRSQEGLLALEMLGSQQ